MVVKINFHGGKNQFSSPGTRANFRAGYACTGNTLIWLACIRGKICNTLIWFWLAFAVKLVRWPPNKFYRECLAIKWECYLCTRSWHRSLRVSPGKKIDFYHRGNWIYHLGNWFLPHYILILPPWKIDFYHHGNWILPPWKLILLMWKMILIFYPFGILFFTWAPYLI